MKRLGAIILAFAVWTGNAYAEISGIELALNSVNTEQFAAQGYRYNEAKWLNSNLRENLLAVAELNNYVEFTRKQMTNEMDHQIDAQISNINLAIR